MTASDTWKLRSKARMPQPIAATALLAGRAAGRTVRLWRRLCSWRRAGSQALAGRSLRDIVDSAIRAEAAKASVVLTEDELQELVDKIVRLLDTVLSGAIGVDEIPSALELLNSGTTLSDFLGSLVRGERCISESKKEMLRRILEENILLRQAMKEVS